MSQVDKGFRASLLSMSWGYDLFQDLVGRKSLTIGFINRYVRPSESGCRLLDLGCGTGAILEQMPDFVDYTGIDLSEAYIETARRKYSERGKFFCSSVESLPESEQNYDIIMAQGLLHHLDDATVTGLAAAAAGRLASGGRFVSIDPVYTDAQSKVRRYLISKDRGQAVRSKEAYLELFSNSFSKIEVEIKHDLLRIPYSHVIMDMSV